MAERERDGVREAGQAERYEPPAARGAVRAEADHDRVGTEADLDVDQGARQRPAEHLGDGLLRRPHGQERLRPGRLGPGGRGRHGGPLGRAEGVPHQGGMGRSGQVLDVDPEAGARAGAHGPGQGGDREGPAVGRGEPHRGQPLPGRRYGTARRAGDEADRAGVPPEARRDGVPQQFPAAPPPGRPGPGPPPDVHRAERGGEPPRPGLRRGRRRHRRRGRGRGRWRASR